MKQDDVLVTACLYSGGADIEAQGLPENPTPPVMSDHQTWVCIAVRPTPALDHVTPGMKKMWPFVCIMLPSPKAHKGNAE